MITSAVKIDAQYEKYDGCQFEGWDAFSAAHTMVNSTHNFELVGDYFYQGGCVWLPLSELEYGDDGDDDDDDDNNGHYQSWNIQNLGLLKLWNVKTLPGIPW